LNVVCDIIIILPEVNCRILEDNQSYITITKSKKPLAYSKYITIKYHHFQSLVDKVIIKIKYIDTKKELTDILTKSINDN